MRASGLTEIGDGSVPGDLTLGVLSKAGEKVDEEVDGVSPGLKVSEDGLVNVSTRRREWDLLTDIPGNLGSRANPSRRARGPKKN